MVNWKHNDNGDQRNMWLLLSNIKFFHNSQTPENNIAKYYATGNSVCMYVCMYVCM